MTVLLTEGEMTILAFAHEHAQGYGERYPFNIRDVSQKLAIDEDDVRKRVTYLDEHGLLGTPAHSNTIRTIAGDIHNVPAGLVGLHRFWLTGNGENFMRALESKLQKELGEAPDAPNDAGRSRKITTKLAGYVMTAGKWAVEEVIKSYVKTMVDPSK